ncbi:hypothetical protein SS50377_25981 [Spironucleus salmonicida]|uniref:Secreted protein n=1 Tax=Spironucleus salmonicida TaxID=348837 RepID=A0A9P8LPC6_9EUKA|nr:hypothetical protein SS50377_25981 [Spironucleus salmonicida]
MHCFTTCTVARNLLWRTLTLAIMHVSSLKIPTQEYECGCTRLLLCSGSQIFQYYAVIPQQGYTANNFPNSRQHPNNAKAVFGDSRCKPFSPSTHRCTSERQQWVLAPGGP